MPSIIVRQSKMNVLTLSFTGIWISMFTGIWISMNWQTFWPESSLLLQNLLFSSVNNMALMVLKYYLVTFLEKSGDNLLLRVQRYADHVIHMWNVQKLAINYVSYSVWDVLFRTFPVHDIWSSSLSCFL